MTTSFRHALRVLALTLFFALPLMADSVAFTDLGPGGDHFVSGFPISGPSQSLANPFTASVGGPLSQIDLGLTNFLGTNSAIISVYTNVNNTLGTQLFSATITGLPPFVNVTSTVLATLYPSSGTLVKGDNYFLVVAPGGTDSEDFWGQNSTGATGNVLLGEGGRYFSIGNNYPLSAFDVRVASATVPEPSSCLMLEAELLFLIGASAELRKLFAPRHRSPN